LESVLQLVLELVLELVLDSPRAFVLKSLQVSVLAVPVP
jgi:hypothetical protein